QLMDGPILDVEQKVNKWISSCLCLHSRVVGLGYRLQRFEGSEKGEYQRRILNSSPIFANAQNNLLNHFSCDTQTKLVTLV
ncbi:MAG: hypothetical protein JZU65_06705, partial [Chlorobium sp.]|nr:hypothetical protein [Chlorobium sp.]